MGGIPDRWTDYRPIGQVIPGTRFIAFKVPLKEALCHSLPKDNWFTPQDIIRDKPDIALIVDLTYTTRYYDRNVFQNANKSYVKILCPGHVVPARNIVSQFFESVDRFLSEHADDESLIGVHCTHGVNRTGYFICKYMIDKMGINPSTAIEDVGRARGYPIERKNYLQDLKGDDSGDSDWRPDHVRERSNDRSQNNSGPANWRGPAGPVNEYERVPNESSAQNDRDRANWRRDSGRDSRRDDRWNPQGDNPRYGRDREDHHQRSPRSFREYNSGRNESWNGRSRPYQQGQPRDNSSGWNDRSRPYGQGPRDNSSERFNRPRSPRSPRRYEGRSPLDSRSNYNDRPNHSR